MKRVDREAWTTLEFHCDSTWRKYRHGSFRGLWTLLLLNESWLRRYTNVLMKISRRRVPRHLIHDAALAKNLGQLETSSRWRVERLLLLLKCFAHTTFEEKVLTIGCRSLFDYTLLIAHGWRRKNLELIDVIGTFRQVKTMSVEKLEYPDETFDVVLCSAVMPYVQRRESAVLEIKRILRPGGYLLAYENAVPKNTYSDLSSNPWITEFEPYTGTCASGRLLYYEKAAVASTEERVVWVIWQKS